MNTHTSTHHSARPGRYNRLLDYASVTCLVLFCLMGFTHYQQMNDIVDIGVYRNIAHAAEQMLLGHSQHIQSEYPPLATALFWAVSTLPFHDYSAGFDLLLVLACILTWIRARCFGAFDALLLALSLPLAAMVCGTQIVFARYDFFVFLLLFLSWRTHHHKRFAEAGGFFAVSILLKIVPVLALPVLFICTPVRSWRRLVVGGVIASIVAFALPALVLGVHGTLDNILYLFKYHSDRGVQLESTWSGFAMFAAWSVHNVLQHDLNHGAYVNLALGGRTILLSKIVILLAVFGVSYRAFKMHPRPDFGALLLPILLLALFFSPVFSPQYILWVVPIVICMLTEAMGGSRPLRSFIPIALLTLFIALSTQWIFPLHYGDLLDQKTAAVFLLNFRNCAVLLLAYLFLVEAGVLPRPRVTHSHQERRLLIRTGLSGIAFVTTLLLFVVLRPALIPTIQNIAYLKDHKAAPEFIFSLPLNIDRDDSQMLVAFDYFLTPLSYDPFLRVRQDDCLDQFMVDGKAYPSDEFHNCDPNGLGRVLNLQGYLRIGHNKIVATVRNTGGAIGFDAEPVPGRLLAAIILALPLTFFWLVFSLFQAWPSLVSLSPRIRYHMRRLWKRVHSPTLTSFGGTEDPQLHLFI